MRQLFKSSDAAERGYWVLAGYLVFVFLMGGGARHDLQSLIVLRPLSVLACAAGLLALDREAWQRSRTLFLLFFAAVALAGAQLVPLPPALWQALAARDLVREIDVAAGLEGVWRPLSLDPSMTWNALFSLSVPLAVLSLGARLSAASLQRLLVVFLVFGLVSGLLGVLQVVGPSRGPLYLYRIANFDSAVGLFANRNHQAIYLAGIFPMLAVHASRRSATAEEARRRKWGALLGGAVLVPFLFNAGSRSGLLLGGVGMVAAYLLYRPRQPAALVRRTVRKFNPVPLIVASGAAVLAMLTLVLSRASSAQRLFEGAENSENRLQVWGPIANQAIEAFPWGTGFGSFAAVFKVIEPRWNLDTSYLNHAHNDWLELLLTGGAFGVALLLLAIFLCSRRAMSAWSVAASRPPESIDFARLGSVLLAMFAIASLVDYPLRTPSLTATAVVALLWLWRGTDKASDRRSR